ncbi:hypothetical protein INR49_015324 [Caranx melampygus]|nr:hypothetical protein INR49_015324 [Caranx melampygus]
MPFVVGGGLHRKLVFPNTGAVVLGAPVMADQEETFGLQNSPGGSDSREVQSDNKSEKQNGTSSKSPSSQTTYIQQPKTDVFRNRLKSFTEGLQKFVAPHA